MKKTNANASAALPQDEQAERLVLGALIMGHEKSGEIFESLVEGDFYDSRNAVIYRTLKAMWEKSLPCELPMLHGQLEAAHDVDRAGGVGYAASLIDGIPRKTPIEKYGATLRAKNVLRELARVSEDVRNAAFDAGKSGTPAAEVIDSYLEKLATIGKMAESEDRGAPHREASLSLLFKLSDEGQIRIFTGLKTLDDMTGGFRAGEVIVLTAETGAGKTFFALQISKRACSDGHHALYASGEMLAEHLMGRVLSSDASVPYYKIRRPEQLGSGEKVDLMNAANQQCRTCRILDGELGLARIRMAARSMASNKELGCVIVDYDELVEVRGKDEWEQQRILVRSLKSLAMELCVPVIMVSQLRKSLDPQDRKRPTLQRLYGSGAKAKHASMVLHVDRPFVRELKGDETEACIFILKSRDGRMGKIDCKFNIYSFKFEE